jgi:hypothetical protein
MDVNDVIETARAFPEALIVPVHYDGWQHFKQGGDDLKRSFETLGFADRLMMLKPGEPTEIPLD